MGLWRRVDGLGESTLKTVALAGEDEHRGEVSEIVAHLDVVATKGGVAEKAVAFDGNTAVLSVDGAVSSHEEELAEDLWGDGSRLDGGDGLSGGFSKIAVDLVEITAVPVGLPVEVELVDGEELVTKTNLLLELVDDLPPALDHPAALAVIGAGVNQVDSSGGEGVAEHVRAVDGAAVDVDLDGAPPGKKGAEETIAKTG